MADFIFYSMVEWHYRWQRPQQIPAALANLGHRVFFISNSIKPTWTDRPYCMIPDDEHGVSLVQLEIPGSPPNPYVGLLDENQATWAARGIQELIRNEGLVDPVAVAQHPFWAPILERLPGQYTIYDCMDHHIGFEDDAPHLQSLESRMIKRADHVVATSLWIHDRIDHQSKSIVPNAVDVGHFSRRLQARTDPVRRPLIGYYGAIAHWFDFEYLAEIARLMPDCDFCLIGEVSSQEAGLVEDLPNISFVGELPYSLLPDHAVKFDVALIPFKITDLTRATNPVKIYEYAALGLPVIATALPELARLPAEIAECTNDPAEAVRLIRSHLESQDVERVEFRQQWAAKQTWTHRAESFLEVLASRPRVSIVVLTYNHLDLTKASLVSLERGTSWPHEIIVVDNCSSDGTQAFLQEWEPFSETHSAILSPENLGFAGGNNLGIDRVTGDIVVLLNNDTEVHNGWLTPLCRTLLRDESIGAVGPATSNSGNESKTVIATLQRSMRLILVDDQISAAQSGFLETNSTAFFCVAMKTDVVREIGPLDTDYGIGMFEDDDYCQRLHRSGYRTGVTFQSFVFHQMSASFDEMGSAKKELFERNKAIFESRWGTWIPHRHLEVLPWTESEDLDLRTPRAIPDLSALLTEAFDADVVDTERRLVAEQRQLLLDELVTELEERDRIADQLLVELSVAKAERDGLQRHVSSLERSRALKLGRLLLLPLRVLRRILRIIKNSSSS